MVSFKIIRAWFAVSLVIAISFSASSTSAADPVLWGSTGQLAPINVATGAVGSSILFNGSPSINASDLAGDAGTQGSLVWGVSFNNQLTAYQPATQQILSTTPITSPESIASLAIDPTTGFFYGASVNNLYRIAPNTGVATLIGATTLPVNKGLGFDSLGNLYGVGNENRLSAVSKSTGAASLIATLNLFRMEDIAIHPETGVMYGVGYGYNPDNYSLYQINLTDGVLTRIGPSMSRPNGLAFTAIPEPSSVVVAMLGAAMVMLKHSRRGQSPNLC